ncbi:MAG: glycoside hydrolase family 2 TIM barrel-domain containing protein [Agathobacter rectalis]
MSNFDSNIIKNPEIFEQNRLAAHSDHVCYKNELEKIKGKSSLRYDMNGLWKFAYAKNQSLAPCGFEAADYDCKGWDEIRVPAHIQMEGYDVPIYTNTTYPWEADESIKPGEVPEIFNPVASYVKYFTIPENMKNKRVCISFQGVESGFALWLNGHYVGYSEDTFDPSDFELTDYIVEGENKLAVRVWKWTSSSWCEDQDFYRFSGIFRDVFLYAVPCAHVEDLSVVPTFNDTFDEGTLSVSIKADGDGIASVKLYELGDLSVEKYDRAKLLLEEFDIELRNKEICEGSCNVKNPLLWSAEKPNLYEVKIIVKDTHGNETEFISQLAGFRRFEMVDGLMKLNGKRIVFKGVNRHEFSSITGRVPNRDEVIKDIVTMKKNNINAIRTSHYPDDSMLYKLCDIYGIYMIAENNLESHGTWEAYNKGYVDLDFVVPKDKPQWREMMLDRVNSCYQRDKNHPAILIWSCGNESFGGKTIYEMSQLFRQLDKHRLVHYEGVFSDRSYNDTSDMESQMYTPAAGIEKFLAEHPEKPFICCEYTHAMGNSCGAMHKYTELTDREPRYQGGFIWDYIDQSIYKKDRYGKWFLTYGGDFGDRPTDGDFSGNGICYGGEREASPKMQEVKFNYQNISVDFDSDYIFTVTNKNLFVNTSVFDAFAILLADGEEVYRTKLQISVPPMERASYEVPVTLKNSMIDVEKEYCIVVSFVLKENTIWEKAGYEIAFGQHMIKKPVSEYSCDKSVELVVGNGNILVRGENFKALFSRMNLGMVSYVYGGVEMLPNTIPLPNFWRTPTNNDSGNMMPQRYAQWKIASMYVTTRQNQRFADTSPRVEKNDNNIAITYTYFMPTTPQSSCEVTYRVFGDGTIETTLSYDPVKELGDMPEFGMMFKLDADYDTVKWYGLGPQETYEDRQHGGKYGVYENKVADNIAEYLVPQESGNKCRVRYAKVMDKKGRGMLFFGDELSFSALPYTPHELENAAHHFELPPVHYTVVRVAKKQMGVGGDDSWGSHTHPEYLLDVSEKMEFTFCFRGI